MKTGNQPPLAVLLVDDDPDDIFLFKEAAEQAAFDIQVLAAEPEVIYQYLEAGKPDVILLDINMPQKDGIEYLLELKSNAEYKEIPIIMYSTSKYKIGDSFTAGANKYFVKPNTFDDLVKLIDQLNQRTWTTKSTSEKDNFFIDLNSM
ncbi:response regulator [Aridibaculum aurantiacum]|uniref:response regulator n=1 Tax=Aridibaculum aurantiacum TaxID=2810307 RepID=UPI001A96C69C|nr:response regulator [Aridibaculum aurantiacum]